MPHADVAIVREAKRLGLVCLPGVATPTEAFAALDAGADGLKMFPAEQLSPAVLKAWRAVLPRGTLVFPVGGIRPDNMAPYWAAGADGFGTGSNLYKPGASAETVRDLGRRLCRRLPGAAARAMSGARFDLVALGEPLLEFNQTRDASDQYLQGFGGDTSNCVIAAARLGAATAYVTRLGDDAFGRKFLALWQREASMPAACRSTPTPTPASTSSRTARSGHEFSYLRAGSAASRMRPSDLPLPVIRSSQGAACVGHQPGDQRQRLRHGVRGDRHGARRRRADLVRFQPAPEALAAAARTGGDRGHDAAVRLVPAEPGRGRPAFRQGASRRRFSTGAMPGARRSSR